LTDDETTNKEKDVMHLNPPSVMTHRW